MSPDRPVDPLTPTALDATRPDPGGSPGPATSVAGYELGAVIGRGGMGEVLLAHDPEIGRHVALKRMRASDPSPEHLSRFLREARIQARLDHPAIVPVHDIGHDTEGRPYFTMKRLAGTTLAALLDAGTESPQRLLRGLVDVCLAVQYAHAQRVVHRDLKPSNIMLGDYGEVYVLDWGVARVLAEATADPASTVDIPSLDGETKEGALLGTPGYMAPEQVQGEEVGPPADVYALGSMLYEILAGAPLHPRGHAALASTLVLADPSPARRHPGLAIAPELDEICVAALDPDPSRRPTARAVAEGIQHYLDGDRDSAARRTHAIALVTEGRDALARGERAEAMRRAGQALIFDPASAEASALVRSLVVEPPARLPDELATALHASEVLAARNRSRRAVVPYLAFFCLLPLLPFLQVVDWRPLLALNVGVIAAIAMVVANVRYGLPAAVPMAVHLVIIVLFSRVSGPLLLTPILICAILPSATAIPWLIERRWAVVGWAATAAVLPFVLEWIGVLGRSWEVSAAGVVSHGTIFAPNTGFGVATMVLANATAVVVVGLYSLSTARDRRAAQRQVQIQAWHLEQILPRATAT